MKRCFSRAKIQELWNSGMSGPEIADLLGTTRGRITAIVCDMRDQGYAMRSRRKGRKHPISLSTMKIRSQCTQQNMRLITLHSYFR